jgi:DNA-binding transcriptional MerR regulator
MENTAQKIIEENINNYKDADMPSAVFRTIGEVASEIGIPPHVLRFWESKFDTIKPHKRKGGHRYYKQADIQAIKDIKRLLYEEGFTIKGAQKFLKEKHSVEELNSQASLFESQSDFRLFSKDFNNEKEPDEEEEAPEGFTNDNFKNSQKTTTKKVDTEFLNNILVQLSSIETTLADVK